MNIIKTVMPATLVVALSLTALPAAAQGRAREDRGRSGREASRAAGPREDRSREAGPRQYGSRDYGRARAMPRYDAPRQYNRNYRDYRGESRYNGRLYGPPRVYTPYYRTYRPRFYERPYYAFRPHTHIGFGLWLGFGVPYPRAWIGGYPPPVYGYYNGVVGVVPGVVDYGGVSFDITPSDALVYLDGTYIGYARDYTPYAVPLSIVPGPHLIEVRAAGYRPVRWHVDVVAGQVVPFRGVIARW